MSDADEVLAHSEDEGEWEDQPVEVERRPTGNQVLSARIPTALAMRVFAEAERRKVPLSEVVRVAIESYFEPVTWKVIKIQPTEPIRFFLVPVAYETVNPVVTTGGVPPLRAAG